MILLRRFNSGGTSGKGAKLTLPEQTTDDGPSEYRDDVDAEGEEVIRDDEDA